MLHRLSSRAAVALTFVLMITSAIPALSSSITLDRTADVLAASCQRTNSGYWYPDPDVQVQGGTFRVVGDGTQVNGGWYEGLEVRFDLQDAGGTWFHLGTGTVGCDAYGYPWLDQRFTVPTNAAIGTAWIRSTHNGIQTCCMAFTIKRREPVTDNIKPSGRWVEPQQNFEEGNDSLKLKAEAWDNDGGSGVAYVKFTAFYNSRWVTIATVYPTAGSNVFEYIWTNGSPVKMSTVPDGPLQLGFDVYPKQGENASSPDAYRYGVVKRPKPSIAWPFKTDGTAGQWAIINGYRGHVDHNGYAIFAFDLALCPASKINHTTGRCTNSNSGWDRENTRGKDVLSPVTGTIRHIDNTCKMLFIEIEGAAGYRIGVSHIDGYPANGQKVTQGEKIGTVSSGGCGTGDHIHMVLYKLRDGAAESPANRTAVAFDDFTAHGGFDWRISGCSYPESGAAQEYEDYLVPCGSKPPPPADRIPAHIASAIDGTWAHSDEAVRTRTVDRTWMWGPESFTGAMTEPYHEGLATTATADGQMAFAATTGAGNRWVQYFDKARMEVTYPNEDSSSSWFVTNGLLVVELITGDLQVGDSQFEYRSPARVNVAGDDNDSSGPTYATFAGLLNKPALNSGSTITQRVDRDGYIWNDPSLASYGVTAAHHVQVPGIDHQIASPFWQFMNATDLVYQDGNYYYDSLFPNPFYATGYPLAEAYWATVKVGGTPRDVLMQCFERRCLTYTPGNPDGWQVEAGNVGRHYYSWRYESAGDDILYESSLGDWSSDETDWADWFSDGDSRHIRIKAGNPGTWAGSYIGDYADAEVSLDLRHLDGVGLGCVFLRANYGWGEGSGYNFCLDDNNLISVIYLGYEDSGPYDGLIVAQSTIYSRSPLEWNTLTVRAVGPTMTFHLNGGHVGSIQHNARMSGAVGMHVASFSDDMVEYEFRNLVVRSVE